MGPGPVRPQDGHRRVREDAQLKPQGPPHGHLPVPAYQGKKVDLPFF